MIAVAAAAAALASSSRLRSPSHVRRLARVQSSKPLRASNSQSSQEGDQGCAGWLAGLLDAIDSSQRHAAAASSMPRPSPTVRASFSLMGAIRCRRCPASSSHQCRSPEFDNDGVQGMKVKRMKARRQRGRQAPSSGPNKPPRRRRQGHQRGCQTNTPHRGKQPLHLWCSS